MEIEGAVRRYNELFTLRKETEREIEEVKAAIKGVMKAEGLKRASVDGFTVSLSLQKRRNLDKSLIPVEVLKKAEREELIEVLYVKPGGLKREATRNETDRSYS
jgi:hypothetical protein